jgi:amidase
LIEEAIAQMRAAGATIIDPVTTGLDLIAMMPDMQSNYYEGIFSHDLYFRRLGSDAPIQSVEQLFEVGGDLVKPRIRQAYAELSAGGLDFHRPYHARLKTQEMVHDAILAMMDAYRIDVLVYPHKTRPPEPHGVRFPDRDNPVSSITGLPALLVPAGYTRAENGPISIEFMGRPFSEPLLFQVGYAYEQISNKRVHPRIVPPLAGESFVY